jgi:D-alanyl-D-alanine carboxypeptidase/D-alanyl-D-alanine-endopeptidase (penicillin-binding protein 4)
LSALQVASSDAHPGLRTAVATLPVAGFSGSLAYRFETGDPTGLGLVRAKTGTLTGVHGLAGTVTSRDGAVMSFVAIADRVRLPNTEDARALLDELAAALAGCACSATP